MKNKEFYRMQEEGKLSWERCDKEEKTVDPNEIILDRDWNPENPDFWKHHGHSKGEYMDSVSSGSVDNAKPPEVYKWGGKYVLINDGSHRVAASQEMNRPIKVSITGEYKEQTTSLDENNEFEMSI